MPTTPYPPVEIVASMRGENSRKRYRLKIEPYYRGNRKTSDEYEATIYEFQNAFELRTPELGRVVWSARKRLRAEVKALAEAQLTEYKYLSDPRRQIVRFNTDKRSLLPGQSNLGFGMLGKTHSAETRAKISAAIKRRYDEGVFQGIGQGRPTKQMVREKLEADAAEAGLTPLGLLAKRARERKHMDALRAEAIEFNRARGEAKAAQEQKRLAALRRAQLKE